jgi:hypothetical protein
MCRKLIAAGINPQSRMEVYRGATLALIVTSIGKAADLEINSSGTGFIRRRGQRPAPPERNSDLIDIQVAALSAHALAEPGSIS